jgi:uncharacterized protein
MPIMMVDARKVLMPHLDDKKPLYIDVTMVDGGCENHVQVPFFVLKKSDCKMSRLLITNHDDTSDTRPLSRTNIIETIRSHRDTVFWDLVGAKRRRMTKTDRVKSVVVEDTVATINIKSTDDDTPEFTMRVLAQSPKTQLHIELTVENIEYLQNVISKQVSRADIKIQHTRHRTPEDKRFDNGGCSGISAHYDDGSDIKALLVKHRLQDGAIKTKTIKVDGDIDRAHLLAKDAWDKLGNDDDNQHACIDDDDSHDAFVSSVQ